MGLLAWAAAERANATGVLNADPLGADQRYAQRNALLSAILPNLTNMRTTPPDPGVAAAMRGGIMNTFSTTMKPSNSIATAQQQKSANLTSSAPAVLDAQARARGQQFIPQ